MDSRQRLMATLDGRPVDRPAVSFYEIGGFQVDPADPDPYNIYNAPSWQPLLRLAEEQTDVIRMGGIHGLPGMSRPGEELFSQETWTEGDSRFTHTSVEVAGRTLTQLIRRVQPDRFEDLIALLALFRPGPLESGMTDEYVERRNGRRPIDYPLSLIHISEPTRPY